MGDKASDTNDFRIIGSAGDNDLPGKTQRSLAIGLHRDPFDQNGHINQFISDWIEVERDTKTQREHGFVRLLGKREKGDALLISHVQLRGPEVDGLGNIDGNKYFYPVGPASERGGNDESQKVPIDVMATAIDLNENTKSAIATVLKRTFENSPDATLLDYRERGIKGSVEHAYISGEVEQYDGRITVNKDGVGIYPTGKDNMYATSWMQALVSGHSNRNDDDSVPSNKDFDRGNFKLIGRMDTKDGKTVFMPTDMAAFDADGKELRVPTPNAQDISVTPISGTGETIRGFIVFPAASPVPGETNEKVIFKTLRDAMNASKALRLGDAGERAAPQDPLARAIAQALDAQHVPATPDGYQSAQPGVAIKKGGDKQAKSAA